MQQLEISFFYPLTEQILLDLDFTSAEEWIAEWRKRQWNNTATSGSFLISVDSTGTTSWGTTSWSQPVTSSIVIKPFAKNVGKWEITDSMFVYRPTKPNAVIRFMAKHLLGFKWHDEN
jgi:hypothetical protein